MIVFAEISPLCFVLFLAREAETLFTDGIS